MTVQTLASKVIAVEKCNSIDFLRVILSCHRDRTPVMPVEANSKAAIPGINVIQRVACSAGGGWFTDRVEPLHDPSGAQISLTSGTTGKPKPILLSHRALGDVTVRLIDAMNLDDGIREYVGVPVTYSFGFGRIRAIAAVGGASFLPERGFRVDEFASMLGRREVNALSAVPTLLRLLLEQKERFEESGRALRWLEIGSQPMSGSEKEAVRTLFPNARIVQHYGLTEASRSTFLDISGAQGDALDSVGRPNGKVEIEITHDGLVAIRGPHVADGVIAEGGVQAITDADGWLVTRDLGRQERGFLFFDGRADDVINVGGIKVAAEAFEEKLLARLGRPLPIAVAPGRDALRGQIVLVAHEPLSSFAMEEALVEATASVAAGLNISDGFAVLPVQSIPRTETNKVKRLALTEEFDRLRQAAAVDVSKPVPATGNADPSRGVVEAFVDVFGPNARDTSASFQSLGGDSLHYVMTLAGLERHLRNVPEDWDTMPIGALCRLAVRQSGRDDPKTKKRQLPDNLDTVRGLACILVVALHVVGVDSTDGLKIANGSAWHSVMNALDLIRLPLFTALAGYLYGAMPATRDGFTDYMKRKAGQLAIPLLFATGTFWILRQIVYGQNERNLFWAYVYGYQHLWYIDALLLIFAFVSLVDTYAKPTWKTWAAVVAVVALSAWAVPDIPIMHIKNTLFLLPYFILGLILYRIPAVLENQMLLALSVIAMISIITLQQAFPPQYFLLSRFGLLGWLCGGASVIALLRLFPKTSWIEGIAAYSFTIYLWHPAANAMVRNILWKFGVDSIAFLFVIGVAVGVIIPILMHVTMLRFPKIVSAPVIGR